MRLTDLRQKVDQKAQLLVYCARDSTFKRYGACVTLTHLVYVFRTEWNKCLDQNTNLKTSA